MPDPADLSATTAARAIAAGTLHPADLLEACLARTAAREPAVHAWAFHDPAAVRAARPNPGPLHGLPLGVKDVFDTACFPSEYNSPIWRGHRPRADAAAVAWARAAGALVFGKTVTTEFAHRHPGPTTNPHDPARTPGGSSSGSAAAVASGMVPFALGTQTAGSVIRPAAFCGVVGYKPTFGLIPRFGMKLMSDTFDTVGTLARGVADCALLAEALSGQVLGDPDRHTGAPPRVGICRTPAWPRAEPDTQALLDRAATRLAAAGATVRDLPLPPVFDAAEAAHAVVMNAESARALGWELTTARAGVSPVLRERLEWGLSQPPAVLADAHALLDGLRLGFPDLLDDLDFLLTPSAPGEAPVGLEWTGDAGFNFLWTALHVPCVTIPAGVGPNGMPLGLQVVARRGTDRAALAWAEWVAGAL